MDVTNALIVSAVMANTFVSPSRADVAAAATSTLSKEPTDGTAFDHSITDRNFSSPTKCEAVLSSDGVTITGVE